MSEYNTKAVEDYWSKVDCSATDKNFYNFPPINERSCQLIFNEPFEGRRDWCEYWTVSKLLKDRTPFAKCLSICCGFGEHERILNRLNLATEFVGVDIAPGAIEEAKKRAAAEGITNIEYAVSDLNTDDILADEYDIIWANGALHHIKDLDIVIPKLFRSLKDNGILVANEYVGPNYQQMGLRQQEAINAVKHLLPAELCNKEPVYKKGPNGMSPVATGVRLSRRMFANTIESLQGNRSHVDGRIFEAPTVQFFLDTDPSEGVNSENIIPTLQKHFSDVTVRYYDGSIVKHALDATFYQNFDKDNPKHRALLELVFQIEDSLIATGEIPRDNAHIICQKN